MRYLLAALFLTVIAAPAAEARTIQQDLDVAHRYWKTDVCRGEWKIIADATLRLRGWQAATRGTDCTIYLDPGLGACDREAALLHEVGHFIHGLGHTGPMAPRVLDNLPCVGERLKQQRVKARWRKDRARIARWWRQ